MRTIDADELKKKLEAEHCDCEVIQIIDDMPTAAEAANAKAAAIMQHYGAEHQKDILIEECAELIQAVEKSRRGVLAEDKPAYTYDMISEMSDVQIMLWQFESVLTAYSRQCFEDEIQRKLRRQMDRISEEVENTT